MLVFSFHLECATQMPEFSQHQILVGYTNRLCAATYISSAILSQDCLRKYEATERMLINAEKQFNDKVSWQKLVRDIQESIAKIKLEMAQVKAEIE